MFYGCDLCEPKGNEKDSIFQRKQSLRVVFVGDFACQVCADCQNKADRHIQSTSEWRAFNDLCQRKIILAKSLIGRSDPVGEKALLGMMVQVDGLNKVMYEVVENFFEANRPKTVEKT